MNLAAISSSSACDMARDFCWASNAADAIWSSGGFFAWVEPAPAPVFMLCMVDRDIDSRFMVSCLREGVALRWFG